MKNPTQKSNHAPHNMQNIFFITGLLGQILVGLWFQSFDVKKKFSTYTKFMDYTLAITLLLLGLKYSPLMLTFGAIYTSLHLARIIRMNNIPYLSKFAEIFSAVVSGAWPALFVNNSLDTKDLKNYQRLGVLGLISSSLLGVYLSLSLPTVLLVTWALGGYPIINSTVRLKSSEMHQAHLKDRYQKRSHSEEGALLKKKNNKK